MTEEAPLQTAPASKPAGNLASEAIKSLQMLSHELPGGRVIKFMTTREDEVLKSVADF